MATVHQPLVALLLAMLCLGGCSVAQAQSSNCVTNCPGAGSPVCANGKRFDSECRARCAGYLIITSPQNGYCDPAPTPTATVRNPSAQANKDTAAGTGAGSSSGNSNQPCACPKSLSPVCGVDGAYFPNPCLAKCVGIKVSDLKPQDGKCGYIVGQKGQWQSGSSNTNINQDNKGGSSRPQEASVVPDGSAPAGGSQACNCPDEAQLVCGKIQGSGKITTYQNACTAKCLGAEVTEQGFCKQGGQPQGTGSQNPSNPQQQQQQQQQQQKKKMQPEQQQQQQQQQQTISAPGDASYSQTALPTSAAPAIQGCTCPRMYEPVCATSGQTLPNACAAYCASAEIAYEGACQGTASTSNSVASGTTSGGVPTDLPLRCLRPCPKIYLPVCAYGVTYPNLCAARCSGIPRFPMPRLGACK